MTNRNHDAGASKNSTKSPLTPKSRYTIAPSDTQAHRRLSRSVTHEVLIKKKKEENLCETWMYDWWDTSCYFAVRFNPIAKYLPIWISLRTGKDMRELVKNARLDIPVTYDDYSNVINTMLLMSALFLAFVAASGEQKRPRDCTFVLSTPCSSLLSPLFPLFPAPFSDTPRTGRLPRNGPAVLQEGLGS